MAAKLEGDDVTVPVGQTPVSDGDGDGDDGMPKNLGDIAPGVDSPGQCTTAG